jgi:hypothetical protein
MVKIGDQVQYWIGITTVYAEVLGFSPAGQVILLQAYEGINHQTGRIEWVEEVYYRDRKFIENLNRGI